MRVYQVWSDLTIRIDRLRSEDALTIWSTMHSFFDFDDRREWAHQFWLLVPFDLHGFDKLWCNSSETSVAEAFIDKTFQIIFRVPPPVISDSKAYFAKQCAIAFPAHQNREELHWLFYLFSTSASYTNRIITPRTIKLFLNKLGAIHRVWHDTIPLLIQAMYLIRIESIASINDQLDLNTVSGINEVVGRDIVSSRIPEWQKLYYALHYGVEPDKAVQVYASNPLRQALLENKLQDAQRLMSLPGISEVLEDIVISNISNWQLDNIVDASLVISNMQISNATCEHTIWDHIIQRCLANPLLLRVTETTDKGIIEIIKRCTSDSERTRLIQSIIELLQNCSAKESQPMLERMPCFLRLLAAIEHEKLGAVSAPSVRLPGDAIKYFELIMAAERYDIIPETVKLNIISYLRPATLTSEIIKELATVITTGSIETLPCDLIELLHVIKKVNVDWEWHDFISVIGNALNSVETPPERYKSLLAVVHVMEDEWEMTESRTAIMSYCESGVVFHVLGYSVGQGNLNQVIAQCIADILRYCHKPSDQANLSSAFAIIGVKYYKQIHASPKNYLELINSIISCLTSEEIDEIVHARINIPETHQFASELLTKRYESTVTSGIINTPGTLVRDFTLLEGLYSKEMLEKTVSSIITSKEERVLVIRHNFDKQLALLYLISLDIPIVLNDSEFCRMIVLGLQSLQYEDWVEAITKNNNIMKLLFKLKDNYKKNLHLAQSFHDALLNHAKGLFNENNIWDQGEVSGSWGRILETLVIRWRNNLLASLRDLIIANASSGLQPFLFCYGEVLSDYDKLPEKANDIVNPLFHEIVKGDIHNELAWMLQVLENQPKLLKKCDLDYCLTLRERIETKIAENVDDLDKVELMNKMLLYLPIKEIMI